MLVARVGSTVQIEPPGTEQVERELPVYPDQATVPRDLRTARELAARGYLQPGPVVGWLTIEPTETEPWRPPSPEPTGETEAGLGRIALHSTSEARRLKGYTWTWPQRGGSRVVPQSARATEGPVGDTAGTAGGTAYRGDLTRRVLNKHTPLLSRKQRRPSVNVEPGRWLTELFREGFVVIDTETTGLSARDEIIEIAAVGQDGTVMFESLVRPKGGFVPAASTRIHGLSYRHVASAPTWPEVMESLFTVISGHRLLAWNAGFDERLCAQSSRAWGVMHPLPGFECAMRAYAACRGVGSGSFRLQRAASVEGVLLDSQAHRSADDARLTVSVLRCLQRSPAYA